MSRACALCVFASLLSAGTIIDQIAVVVDKHAIKTSDIDRDLRVTQFLNGQTLDLSRPAKRTAVQRLIDQELIRNEIDEGGVEAQVSSEATGVLDQLRKERFKNSESEMKAALLRYGLTPEQLSEQLQWQMAVLRFIDQRFRPGVIVEDSDIRAYFDQHQAELKKKYPKEQSLEALTPQIREIIEGERINRNFEDWLQHAREMARVKYKLDELK